MGLVVEHRLCSDGWTDRSGGGSVCRGIQPARLTDTRDIHVLIFVGQILERSAFRLRNQHCREHARQHEESEDLENVLDEVIRTADIL